MAVLARPSRNLTDRQKQSERKVKYLGVIFDKNYMETAHRND
jgi:hypothetical protein